MATLNLKTGSKVLSSFALVLLVMACITGLALWRLHCAHLTTENLVKDKLAKQNIASEWLGAAKLNGVRTVSIAKSDSVEVADFFQEQLSEGDKAIQSLKHKLQDMPSEKSEKALLRESNDKERAYLAVRTQVFSFKDQGRIQEVEQLAETSLKASFANYTAALEKLLTHQSKQAQVLARESASQYEGSRMTLIAFGLLAIALGGVLAWFITRSVVQPLNHAVNLAKRVADGDLRPEPRTNRMDEFGQLLDALHDMTARLGSMVMQVRDGAHLIDHAAKELASGNLRLSRRTENQGVSLEKTALSMEELTLAVRQNSESARSANALAQSASDIAGKGGKVVVEVVQTMDEISSSATKIVDIISIIDGIAFQTNILALNAAVEAARAGEQGRGFAVVASEVRSLAQRSATAAREIATLIKDSSQRIEAGVTLTHAAGDTMSDIESSIKQVTGIMAEISEASSEQENGIKEINRAVGDMDSVTQQNAALVEEAATMANAIHKEANKLTQLVSLFKFDTAQVRANVAVTRLKHTEQAFDPEVETAAV